MKTLKNIFIPHRHNGFRPHAIRAHGLAIVVLFVAVSQFAFNLQTAHQMRVLGYATSVSVGELHAITNQNRAASGLPALSLNGALSSAAQNKANHMIANNYWDHVAPDGTTPWYFISAAGYSYTRAGENLAYGYSTSAGVMSGWMASPSHAANILDSQFTEVGFGYANGSNFQGGENTVVVAMYANPVAPAPAPAPPAPVTTPEPAPAPETTPVTYLEAEPEEPAPKPEKQETKQQETEDPIDNTSEESTEGVLSQRYLAQLAEDGTILITGDSTGIKTAAKTSNYQALISGQAHWALYVMFGALTALAGIFALRHAHALKQVVVDGEHYVGGHPLLEAALIYGALWSLLLASYGAIL